MHLRVVAGLVVAGVALTACGPSGGSAPTAAPTAGAPAAKPPAAASPAAQPPAAASPAASPLAAPSPGAPAVTISGPFEGEAKALNGAGGTFPQPLYSKWFDEYATLTGVQVNYQGIGSGGGIKGIQDQTVDFAGSDAPMTDEQLKAAKGGELFHIPTALGGIVPTYNLPGVDAKLKFTPDSLAGIYLGTINKWNDPKLVADNPELANVDQEIVVVHRSDGSGTTFGFTDYLSTVSQEWQSSVGKGTSVNWPVGLGGKGNDGVAGEVKQNAYSVGYVELIYAVQNNLGFGQVRNKAGTFVEPTLDSVTAAAAGVAQSVPADLRFSIVDAPGPSAYPICTGTWLLAYKSMTDKPKAVALTRLLWWATHEAQRFNNELGYAPVPNELTAKSEGLIRQISAGGEPAFPGR